MIIFIIMICVKCHAEDAEYDAPDDWCVNCWNDWYFDVEYNTDLCRNAHEKYHTILHILYERALKELGEDAPVNLLVNRVKELGQQYGVVEEHIIDTLWKLTDLSENS